MTSMRARRREQTHAEILAAAWSICREGGLAALSMREVALRVGMRAPSLYTYLDSKDQIYDAMFAQGQRALLDSMCTLDDLPPTRAGLREGARRFVDFCVEDPIRYQLMFQRPVPGFTPTDASYALAMEYYREFERQMNRFGVTDARDLDLWTALVTGLTDQQISNDPGGERWVSLVTRAADMFCDFLDLDA